MSEENVELIRRYYRTWNGAGVDAVPVVASVVLGCGGGGGDDSTTVSSASGGPNAARLPTGSGRKPLCLSCDRRRRPSSVEEVPVATPARRRTARPERQTEAGAQVALRPNSARPLGGV